MGLPLNQSAIQIVAIERKPNGTPIYRYDREALKKLLTDPRIRDLKVSVISIVGKFRQGKSFAANNFLRYLHHISSHPKREKDWLSGSTVVNCFEWRADFMGVTSGIWLCPVVFVLRLQSGEEVAVVVIDTQGIDDPSASRQESTLVFGLPLLLSSVTLYNVSENIDLTALEHIQFYSEYGRMAVAADDGIRPFQSLTLLVRDWRHANNPKGFPCGFDGGQKFVQTILQKPHNEEVKQFVATTFRRVECCLLPFPGQQVEQYTFSGDINETSDVFKNEFTKLLEELFLPENLEKKLICGKSVTCEEWFDYFDQYMQVFSSGKLPPAHSLVEVTARIQNTKLRDECIGMYHRNLEMMVSEDPWIDLARNHGSEKQAVFKHFDNTPKMGGDQLSEPYREQLEALIPRRYAIVEEVCVRKRQDITENATAQMLHDYRKQMTKLLTDNEKDEPLSRTAFRRSHDQFKEEAVNSFRSLFEPYSNTTPAYDFKSDVHTLASSVDNEFRAFEHWNESYLNAADRRKAMEKNLAYVQEQRDKELEFMKEQLESERKHFEELEQARQAADERRRQEQQEREQEWKEEQMHLQREMRDRDDKFREELRGMQEAHNATMQQLQERHMSEMKNNRKRGGGDCTIL